MCCRIFRCAWFGLTVLIGCQDPPVAHSIRQGNPEDAKKLITEGANVNAKDSKGRTALHAALTSGYKETYLQLLRNGANPNLCDHSGKSVVHLASEQQDIYWLREAMKHGGNPNQLNTGNRTIPKSTPIFYAIRSRHSEPVLELIALGADVNHLDSNNCTPLYICMEESLYPLMVNLLDAGADPTPPKPASSIYTNGWFTADWETQLGTGETTKHYFALKEQLIQMGHLKPMM